MNRFFFLPLFVLLNLFISISPILADTEQLVIRATGNLDARTPVLPEGTNIQGSWSSIAAASSASFVVELGTSTETVTVFFFRVGKRVWGVRGYVDGVGLVNGENNVPVLVLGGPGKNRALLKFDAKGNIVKSSSFKNIFRSSSIEWKSGTTSFRLNLGKFTSKAASSAINVLTLNLTGERQ